MRCTVRVDGVPVAKARPRVARGRMYTPSTTTAFEVSVAKSAGLVEATWPAAPAPILVHIDAVYPRPAGRPKWLPKRLWALGLRFTKATRPDGDNICKAVLDGLQRADVGGGVAPTGRARRPGTWIGDDARMEIGSVRRWYGAPGEEPHTLIRLEVVHDFGVE